MADWLDLTILALINVMAVILPIIYIPLLPHYCLQRFLSNYYPNWKKLRNPPETHKQKVQRLQAQVQNWNKEGRKRKMCSSRKKGLTIRSIDKTIFTQIELDEMDDIIEIDLENMLVKVEPGIEMGTLTQQLLPLGVIIPVIPEFEMLTVGGLINGAGLETSSHRYGLFASTCLEYEVVLADGRVVNCTKDQYSDLFYSMPMAYGTLGFMTSVTFPLIKAGKYVKVEYHAARNLKEAETLLRRTENLFVEGIAFSKEKSVIMFGNFSDSPQNGKINRINRWYKNWFFQHVEGFLHTTDPVIEYIPTRHYYHRHTRPYFWALPAPGIMRTRIYIFLFGWIFPISTSIMKKIIKIDLAFKRYILQDYVLPMENFEATVKLSDELTAIYPLWFCPCKMYKRPGFVNCRGETDADYFDIGIYGAVFGEKRKCLGGDAAEAVMKFEQFTVQNNGFQGMYTDCYLSPEDFNKMFDRSLYDKLRTELNCLDAFPDVYEKISINFKKY